MFVKETHPTSQLFKETVKSSIPFLFFANTGLNTVLNGPLIFVEKQQKHKKNMETLKNSIFSLEKPKKPCPSYDNIGRINRSKLVG